MQILFIDESGTPPPPNKAQETPFFVLGGVVVPEDLWRNLSEDLNRLKNQFNLSGEIKWRYFAPQKPGARPHSLSHLTKEQKEILRTKLYETVRNYKSIRLICVVTYIPSAYKDNAYIKTADDIYWYSYKQLTQRFQYYLQDLERTVGERINGIVVCDHRAPKDDERLRDLHHQLQTTTSHYKNLVEGLFIAPSHLSTGIQFADMIAGAVFRQFKANDARFFNQIQSSFRHSPKGKIEGFGLVKFPQTPWNI